MFIAILLLVLSFLKIFSDPLLSFFLSWVAGFFSDILVFLSILCIFVSHFFHMVTIRFVYNILCLQQSILSQWSFKFGPILYSSPHFRYMVSYFMFFYEFLDWIFTKYSYLLLLCFLPFYCHSWSPFYSKIPL